MDVDVGDHRGLVWANKCAEALNGKDLVALEHLRKCARHFKRKKEGEYDEMFEKLVEAAGLESGDEEG